MIAHILTMENFKTLSRRQALTFGAASFAAPMLAAAVAEAAAQPVLVELFTSQGCSSCPAADRLAAKLKDRPGVQVVSFNVDYWDYLGWRDTLASPDYTKRQMDYAHARGDNDVYTPQMVINGDAHVVGSSQASVESAIAAAAKSSSKISISLKATDKDLIVELGDGADQEEGTLWLMAIAPQVDVKIERGENSGSTISYHNVVRKLVPAGTWMGKATKLMLPKNNIMIEGSTSCLAVLQKRSLGPVIGFAQLGNKGT